MTRFKVCMNSQSPIALATLGFTKFYNTIEKDMSRGKFIVSPMNCLPTCRLMVARHELAQLWQSRLRIIACNMVEAKETRFDMGSSSKQ